MHASTHYIHIVTKRADYSFYTVTYIHTYIIHTHTDRHIHTFIHSFYALYTMPYSDVRVGDKLVAIDQVRLMFCLSMNNNLVSADVCMYVCM